MSPSPSIEKNPPATSKSLVCKIPFFAVDRELCVITRITVSEGNVGAATHIPGKEASAKVDNLESIVGEKKPAVDFLKRQRFAEEDVIHSTRPIDVDFESSPFLAAKLVDAVRSDRGRLMKFVRRDVFRQI